MRSSHKKIAFSNGVIASLQSLDQWQVYGDLIEGIPTRRMNDAELASLARKAEARDGHAPLLIAPVQTPIPYEGRYPFGEPVKLPEIACIGRFRYSMTVRDHSMDRSALTIIWFQDEYAFPLSEEVARAFGNVDWNAVAYDENY